MRAISPSAQQAQPDATSPELGVHWQPAGLEQQLHFDDDFLLNPVEVQPQPVAAAVSETAAQAVGFNNFEVGTVIGVDDLDEQHEAETLGEGVDSAAAMAGLPEQQELETTVAAQGLAESRLVVVVEEEQEQDDEVEKLVSAVLH